MFGHQDDKPKIDSDNVTISEEPVNDSSQPGAPTFTPDPSPQADDQAWQHPGEPMSDQGQEPAGDVVSPAGGFPKPPSFPKHHDEPIETPTISSSNDDMSSNHELIDIKQRALTELVPLIDELDQTPEEKFHTLMMMIQASDNEGLVSKAYEVAHSIENEKIRAQALLDIVNEVNYFTHQPPIEG